MFIRRVTLPPTVQLVDGGSCGIGRCSEDHGGRGVVPAGAVHRFEETNLRRTPLTSVSKVVVRKAWSSQPCRIEGDVATRFVAAPGPMRPWWNSAPIAVRRSADNGMSSGAAVRGAETVQSMTGSTSATWAPDALGRRVGRRGRSPGSRGHAAARWRP